MSLGYATLHAWHTSYTNNQRQPVDRRCHLEFPIFAFFIPLETKTPLVLQIIFHLDEMMKLLHVHLGFWSFRLNPAPLPYA
jgi:hypothetical protein